MHRFPHPVFVAAGLRTPFGRGGGALARYDAINLSTPVVRAMASQAEPDLVVWGTVIPNLGWSNIAREIWLDAKLNPNVPAFSATGARDLSQAVKELWSRPVGSRAIASVCADGGQGTVALLERA